MSPRDTAAGRNRPPWPSGHLAYPIFSIRGETGNSNAAEQLPSVHPTNPGIHTINQTLFAGPLTALSGVKAAKNAVVVSPGRIDRSPCGTGSSARMAAECKDRPVDAAIIGIVDTIQLDAHHEAELAAARKK